MATPIRQAGLRADPLAACQGARAPVEADLFVNPDIYAAEMERLFRGESWHIVGHVAEFPQEGCYKTHRIGNVPVIVSRADGLFHVMVNSCAHRGAQVVRGSRGIAKTKAAFTCIYHQWVYDAGGCAMGVGRRQGYPEGFSVADHGLPRAKVGVIGGLIFASLGRSPPDLREYLGKRICDTIDRLYSAPDLKYAGVQRAVFQCNWKLYVENIYDSYHAVTLHKGFRLMNIRKPAPQLEDAAIIRHGHYLTEYQADVPGKIDLNCPEIFEARSRHDGLSSHVVANVFPASQFTEQLDVLAYRIVVPRGPNATEIQFHVLVRESDDDGLRAHRMWQASNFLGPQGLINLEDAAALARVQVSMQGRDPQLGPSGGMRFPDRRPDEQAIDSFYDAYRRAMQEAAQHQETGQ
ncbi:MAG: aromatic ring-hydroxylating dioxygenase subunit alpha [Burkholderiaceae bacterium]|nr:aromatic ring-hydroxylating dioxygenase subunit alpha [Burkholderiaceae bacterium]